MLAASRCLVETELRVRVARDCPNVKACRGSGVEAHDMEGEGGKKKGLVTGERVARAR